jgi:hypothetical protein
VSNDAYYFSTSAVWAFLAIYIVAPIGVVVGSSFGMLAVYEAGVFIRYAGDIVYILLGMLGVSTLAGLCAGTFALLVSGYRTRRALIENVRVDEAGIRIENRRGQTWDFGWEDVTEADVILGPLGINARIEIQTRTRPEPIVLVAGALQTIGGKRGAWVNLKPVQELLKLRIPDRLNEADFGF